jgi:hypothetical protein
MVNDESQKLLGRLGSCRPGGAELNTSMELNLNRHVKPNDSVAIMPHLLSINIMHFNIKLSTCRVFRSLGKFHSLELG